MSLLKCHWVEIFFTKDLKLSKQNCASEDEMITLHTIQPGVMVAVWKHSWKVFLESYGKHGNLVRGGGNFTRHPYGRQGEVSVYSKLWDLAFSVCWKVDHKYFINFYTYNFKYFVKKLTLLRAPSSFMTEWMIVIAFQSGGELAWVSVCLHYHQLVEKILRGTTER